MIGTSPGPSDDDRVDGGVDGDDDDSKDEGADNADCTDQTET